MSQDEVLVSVLVTNFNYARYIEQSVRSVAAQTYSPLELIIVDDGSTDNSREVIERLATQHKGKFRNLMVVYKPNGGLNSALNMGFPYVNGEVTIFFDSDDVMFPEYVSRTTELLLAKRAEGVGFVYTNAIFIDKEGQPWLDESGNSTQSRSASFDEQVLRQRNYIPGCGAVLTEALRQIFPLNLNVEPGKEKQVRWLAVVSKGYKGFHIPEPLFCYRQHEDNISGVGDITIPQLQSGRREHFIFSGLWPAYKPDASG